MPPAASLFSFVILRDHGPVSPAASHNSVYKEIRTTFRPIAILRLTILRMAILRLTILRMAILRLTIGRNVVLIFKRTRSPEQQY